jgi:hypothetical protein
MATLEMSAKVKGRVANSTRSEKRKTWAPRIARPLRWKREYNPAPVAATPPRAAVTRNCVYWRKISHRTTMASTLATAARLPKRVMAKPNSARRAAA